MQVMIQKSYELVVRVERTHAAAVLPRVAHEGDAGYDLVAPENVVIPAFERAVVPLGIKMHIPSGWYGEIKARSGLSAKHCIEVGAGVVDSGYRGEVKVVLINMHKSSEFAVKRGMAIAQMVFHRHGVAKISEVEDVKADTGAASTRGTDGFGSTDNGIHAVYL